MNLRARFLGLILLSAPLFFSCGEEENTIGLPPENDLGIFFAEIPLGEYSNQVWVDNLSTRGRDAMLAGSFEDENFGTIRAQHFTEILLPEINPGKRFQEDASYDSMVLELRVTGAAGNNLLGATQRLEVYQLADTIRAFEASYYNHSTQEITDKLGEGSFTFYPDSLGLTMDDTGVTDSSDERSLYDGNGNYIYLNRIPFDDMFGARFFNELKTDTTENSNFSSSIDFAAYFKGLNIKGLDGNSAIIRYSPADTRTRLVVYYSQVENDTLRQKQVNFPMSRSLNYNNIEPNKDVPWSGSDFDQITEMYTPYVVDSDFGYAQAGTNLFLGLDMSPFKAMTDTIDDPIVQNAVLFFRDVEPAQRDENTILGIPRYLSFRLTNQDTLSKGYYDVIPNVFSEFPRQSVEYDDDIDGFKIEIPLYLQTLINRTNNFDQVIITASSVDPTTGAIGIDNRSFDRFVINKENIFVRLYYTIPDANTE